MNPIAVAGAAMLAGATLGLPAHAACPAKTTDIKTTADLQACFDALNQMQGNLAAQQVAIEKRLAELDAKEAATAARVAALPGGMRIVLRDNHGTPAQCDSGEVMVGGECWLEDGSGILQNAGISDDPKYSNAIPPRSYNCTWTSPGGHVVPHMVAACLVKAP